MSKAGFDRLMKQSGAVTERRDVHADVLRTPSPSMNFMYGKGWGLPRGYGTVYYGPPKCGKSVLLYQTIGEMHRTDPDSYAVVFNTEMRDEAQLSYKDITQYGIDPKRYICYQTNEPEEIYDRIADERAGVYGEILRGMKVGIVGIDSINAVRGRRSLNAKSISVQQIGDKALTNKEGLQWILKAQRRGRFALIVTTHVSAEMDPQEQARGVKVRMAASWGLQHHFEYYVFLEPLKTKEGRVDLLGQSYVPLNSQGRPDTSVGAADRKAHRVRATMKDSSLGPKGRVAEFTFDEQTLQVINAHEEVFKLAVNRGVVARPNKTAYEFGGKKWTGKDNFVRALRDEPELQVAMLKELHRRDLAGELGSGEPVEVAEDDIPDEATFE